MKKIALVLIIFVCAGAALFAQNNSFGIGIEIPRYYTNFVFSDKGKEALTTSDFGALTSGLSLFAYLEMKFIEANVGFLFGKYEQNSSLTDVIDFNKAKIGLYGKIPINLGTVQFFPMLGADFQLSLDPSAWKPIEKPQFSIPTLADDIKKMAEDRLHAFMNNVWFKFGLGADFNLSKQLNLHTSFLYGIRLESALEKELKDLSDEMIKGIVGHGFDIRIGFGIRF